MIQHINKILKKFRNITSYCNFFLSLFLFKIFMRWLWFASFRELSIQDCAVLKNPVESVGLGGRSFGSPLLLFPESSKLTNLIKHNDTKIKARLHTMRELCGLQLDYPYKTYTSKKMSCVLGNLEGFSVAQRLHVCSQRVVNTSKQKHLMLWYFKEIRIFSTKLLKYCHI